MSRLNTAGKNNKVHFHIHNLHAAPRPKFMNKIYSRMYRIFLLVFKHTETPRLIQMKTAYTLDSPKKKKTGSQGKLLAQSITETHNNLTRGVRNV